MSSWPVVAGIPIVARAPGLDTPGHWLLPEWSDTPANEPPLEIRYEVGDTSDARLRVVVASDDPTVGSYYADERGELAVRASTIDGALPQLMRTERAGASYVVRYARAADLGDWQWRWPRNVFTHAIAARRTGLVAHAAAALVPGGGVVLCPGVSGDGKSTIARALGEGGATVLSDDRVALIRDPECGVRAWGTPWYSSAHRARGDGGPLSAVVFLDRGGAIPQLRSVPRADALRRLMRSLALPVWSPALLDFALELTTAVLAAGDVVSLAWTPDDGVGPRLVSLLDATFGGAHVA